MSARRGFTVLEAAIAMAIIGLTSVGVLGAISAATRGVDRSRRQLEASALAQSVGMRLATIDRMVAEALPDSLAKGRFDDPFGDYTWRVGISTVRNEFDLFDVRVVVSWTEGEFELGTRRFLPAELASDR